MLFLPKKAGLYRKSRGFIKKYGVYTEKRGFIHPKAYKSYQKHIRTITPAALLIDMARVIYTPYNSQDV